MKLEDWYRNKGWLVQDPTDLEENKHVISTCEFCEHQGKWEPIDMCNSPHNQDFGCVYWSEKK